MSGAPGRALAQSSAGQRNEAGDRFGQAFAFGDFDGDGRMDLAVAAAGESTSDAQRTGAILIFRGTGAGLQFSGVLDQTLLGRNEANDAFGSALAAGDFNKDGIADLAVGIPGEAPDAAPAGSGAVVVFRGSRSGLRPVQFLTQAAGGLGTNGAGDSFGATLAVGDFNADGTSDLAVGASAKTPANGLAGAGAVYVFLGTSTDLMPAQRLMEETGSFAVSKAGDAFGAALAVGDFDGDRIDDLAIGASGKGPRSDPPRSGFVFVFRGSRAGLSPAQGLEQELAAQFTNQENDRFGAALAAGDFDGDGRDDLAVGAPGDGAAGAPRASGVVYLFRGMGMGLAPQGALAEEQGSVAGVTGVSQANDQFGLALAAGDFDGDRRDDLAVSAPTEVTQNGLQPGVLFLFRGMRDGLRGAGGFAESTSGFGVIGASGDRFGVALASGDLDGDGRADLAVGAPGKAVDAQAGSGLAFLYGGAPMNLLRPSLRLQQDLVSVSLPAAPAAPVPAPLLPEDPAVPAPPAPPALTMAPAPAAPPAPIAAPADPAPIAPPALPQTPAVPTVKAPADPPAPALPPASPRPAPIPGFAPR